MKLCPWEETAWETSTAEGEADGHGNTGMWMDFLLFSRIFFEHDSGSGSEYVSSFLWCVWFLVSASFKKRMKQERQLLKDTLKMCVLLII